MSNWYPLDNCLSFIEEQVSFCTYQFETCLCHQSPSPNADLPDLLILHKRIVGMSEGSDFIIVSIHTI